MILVVDEVKLGRVQLMNVAPLDAIHTLVTDGAYDNPTVVAAREIGVDVLSVSTAPITNLGIE